MLALCSACAVLIVFVVIFNIFYVDLLQWLLRINVQYMVLLTAFERAGRKSRGRKLLNV